MTLYPVVTAKWLSENLDLYNLIVLDASSKSNKSNLVAEFPDIQIKGARHFDMETVFYDKESTIPNMIPTPEIFEVECKKLGINKNSIIVVYDNLGIYTSPRAWYMFKAMGHENIAVLDGGLPAWKREGFPCEQKKSYSNDKGDFVVNYQAELVRDSIYILDKLDQDDVLIVDARSEARFSGKLPEPRENMASGHIPSSVNLPYNKVLENGKMKTKQELMNIFDSLKPDKKQLIFTCGSGITACIILLASELVLPNEKSMFDGSWSEWGQLNKFPVGQ